MLGDNPFFRCSVIVTCLMAGTAWSAPTAEQRMFDRMQEQQQQRQQQQLDEMQVPGEEPARLPVPEASSSPGPCFTIQTIQFKTLSGDPVPFGGWFTDPAREAEGDCMDMTAIRALQARLSNALIDRGYVTSRVLIPEQDIASGALVALFARLPGSEATGYHMVRAPGPMRPSLERFVDWLREERDGEPPDPAQGLTQGLAPDGS